MVEEYIIFTKKGCNVCEDIVERLNFFGLPYRLVDIEDEYLDDLDIWSALLENNIDITEIRVPIILRENKIIPVDTFFEDKTLACTGGC